MIKNKNIKNMIILFLITSFLCSFIIVPYILNDEVFYLGWDMRTQYSSFFEELRTLLREGVSSKQIPFYSWNYFLGNNFFANKLFYYHDFIDWFFALFTNWSYSFVIVVETVIKYFVSVFSFYTYAKYNNFSDRNCMLGSIMFSFSAFGLQIMMHPFFATFFVFMPLYFLSVDYYLKRHRCVLYILISTFLIIINYYMFYSLSLFTILYFIYKYYRKYQKYGGVIKCALPLIGAYFVAVLLSGVVLIPEALSLLSNNRIGNNNSILFYGDIKPYLELITGLFTPTSAIANRTDAAGNLYAYTSRNNSLMPVFIWISSVGSLLIPQTFCKDKNSRISIIVIVLLAIVPFLSSVLHGFSEPSFRWLCFPTFLFVVMCLESLEKTVTINEKILYLIIVLSVVSTPIIGLCDGVSFNEYKQGYFIILISTIPFVLLTFKYINSKYLIVIVIMEMLIVSYFSYYGNPMFRGYKKDTIYASTHVLGQKGELVNYLNELDESNLTSFYRIYVDPSSIYWDYSSNYNLNYNFMGVLSYDTTYAYSIYDLNTIAPISTYLPWAFDIRNDQLLDILSVKYALVTDVNQLPSDNYEYIGDYNFIHIYQNKDYTNLSVDNFNVVDRKINYLYADINLDNSKLVTLSIPYDKGWKIAVNGKSLEPIKGEGGLLSINLEKGYNEIVMNYIPKGLKTGVYSSVFGVILIVLFVILEKRK